MDKKYIIIDGLCGSGKTKFALEYINSLIINSDDICLIICPRVIMIQEIISKINTIIGNIPISIYCEKVVKKNNSKYILTTFESLYKVCELHLNQKFYILLDEFQLLIEQVYTSPIDVKNRIYMFNMLMKYIERCKQCFFIDPFLFNETIEFIKQLSSNTFYLHYIPNTYISIEYCNLYECAETFFNLLNDSILNNIPCHIHSDSKKFIISLYEKYKDIIVNPSLLYTADLKIYNKNQIKNVNIKLIKNLKYLFTSPSINSCISIEDSTIKDVFAIKTFNHINNNDLLNSLYRIRTLKRIHIIDLFPISKNKNFKFQNYSELTDYKWIENLNKLFSSINLSSYSNLSIIKKNDYNHLNEKFLFNKLLGFNKVYDLLIEKIIEIKGNINCILNSDDKLLLINFLINNNVINDFDTEKSKNQKLFQVLQMNNNIIIKKISKRINGKLIYSTKLITNNNLNYNMI